MLEMIFSTYTEVTENKGFQEIKIGQPHLWFWLHLVLFHPVRRPKEQTLTHGSILETEQPSGKLSHACVLRQQ